MSGLVRGASDEGDRRGVEHPVRWTVVMTITPPRRGWRVCLWCVVALSFDQPLGVLELDEVGDSLAEVVEVVVEPGPEALLLEGLDPAFGAAIGLGFTDVGRVVEYPQP